MVDETQEKISEKDKVQILLHEYDTLRTELIHRGNNMYQLVAVAGAIVVWLVSRVLDARFWILLVLAGVVVSIFSWFIYRDMTKAAERVRQLEKDINKRAREELLIWETQWGGAVTGYWGQAKPKKDGGDAQILK